MSQDVEELFGEGTGAPTARTGLVWVLLIVGLAITALGMVCTAAPGAILVLLAWYVVEKEADRIDSGYLPPTARLQVRRARIATLIGVLVVTALLIAQSLLVGFDLYGVLWTRILLLTGLLTPAAP